MALFHSQARRHMIKAVIFDVKFQVKESMDRMCIGTVVRIGLTTQVIYRL